MIARAAAGAGWITHVPWAPIHDEQIWYGFVQFNGRQAMSVASEYDHAEQVVADVALLQDMAAGRLDGRQVRDAAEVLLAHRRHELPSVSVAVAARLLGVSRTTIEAWLQTGVLIPAAAKRRRHEVTIDSLVRLQILLGELRRLGKSRELRDYVWWSAQDAADSADGKLAEALHQLRAGELGDEYVPSPEDLSWARRQLRNQPAEEQR
jgi:hypothetical protein